MQTELEQENVGFLMTLAGHDGILIAEDSEEVFNHPMWCLMDHQILDLPKICILQFSKNMAIWPGLSNIIPPPLLSKELVGDTHRRSTR